MVVVFGELCLLRDGVEQADRLVQDFSREARLCGERRVQLENAEQEAVGEGADGQAGMGSEAVALPLGVFALGCGADGAAADVRGA